MLFLDEDELLVEAFGAGEFVLVAVEVGQFPQSRDATLVARSPVLFLDGDELFVEAFGAGIPALNDADLSEIVQGAVQARVLFLEALCFFERQLQRAFRLGIAALLHGVEASLVVLLPGGFLGFLRRLGTAVGKNENPGPESGQQIENFGLSHLFAIPR